jgi:hypothetical protein
VHEAAQRYVPTDTHTNLPYEPAARATPVAKAGATASRSRLIGIMQGVTDLHVLGIKTPN